MITEGILNFFLGVFTWCLDRLPTWNISLDVAKFQATFNFIQQYNTIAPVEELLICMSLSTGLLVSMLGYMLVMKIINVVRGSGG